LAGLANPLAHLANSFQWRGTILNSSADR